VAQPAACEAPLHREPCPQDQRQVVVRQTADVLLWECLARYASHRQGKVAEHGSRNALIDGHISHADRDLRLIRPDVALEVRLRGSSPQSKFSTSSCSSRRRMRMAIQARIARMRASVGPSASLADASSARLSSSRFVHLISTRGRARSGATRSSRGKSRILRSPPALSLRSGAPVFAPIRPI
jgi:hypothetical protein